MAFGTAAGIVVLVDLEAGTVLDGFDAHTDEITALEWAGSEKLISGGADGAVVVYSPSRCGESSLFELVEVDDFEDDFDDDEEDAGVLDRCMTPWTRSKTATTPTRCRARTSRSIRRRLLPRAEGRPHHHRAPAGSADVADVLGEMTEAPGIGRRARRCTKGPLGAGDWCPPLDAKASKVLSASLDRRVLLWDVEQGDCREVAVAPSAICCLAVADGVAVVGLLDGSVEGYDLEDGARVFRLEDAHEGAVRSVHFGDDGSPSTTPTPGRAGGCCARAAPTASWGCYTMRGGDGEPLQPTEGRWLPLEAEDVPIHFRGRRSGPTRSGATPAPSSRCRPDDTKLVSASIDGRRAVLGLADGRAAVCAGWALEAHHVAPLRGPSFSLRRNWRKRRRASRARCGVDAPFDVRCRLGGVVVPHFPRHAIGVVRHRTSSFFFKQRTPSARVGRTSFAIASRFAFAMKRPELGHHQMPSRRGVESPRHHADAAALRDGVASLLALASFFFLRFAAFFAVRASHSLRLASTRSACSLSLRCFSSSASSCSWRFCSVRRCLLGRCGNPRTRHPPATP